MSLTEDPKCLDYEELHKLKKSIQRVVLLLFFLRKDCCKLLNAKECKKAACSLEFHISLSYR